MLSANAIEFHVRLLTGALLLAFAGASPAATFYVSAAGNDAGAGTAEDPFASPARAVEASRAAGPAGGAHRVVLRGGAYYDVSLTLDARDNGLTLEAAAGERPVLYGGVRVGGWERDGDRFFAAKLPPLPDGRAWDVRMIQVDGKAPPRARLPLAGRLKHRSKFDARWMTSTGGGWERKPTPAELTTLRFDPTDLPAGFEPRDAELTVYHMWDESNVGVTSVDRDAATLHFSHPASHPAGAFGVDTYAVWNTREGLAEPGRWYHDRVGGRIVYWPLPGQRMDDAAVIVPTRTTVIALRGTAGAPVSGVRVRGVGVAVTTVPLITGGFAAARFDGAVSLEHAHGATFEDMTVIRVGGHAFNARDGCRDVVVRRCEAAECGAGGIYV